MLRDFCVSISIFLSYVRQSICIDGLWWGWNPDQEPANGTQKFYLLFLLMACGIILYFLYASASLVESLESRMVRKFEWSWVGVGRWCVGGWFLVWLLGTLEAILLFTLTFSDVRGIFVTLLISL